MMEHLKKWMTALQRYASRWWYPPLVALLAFADLFLLIIPTDGLIVSAVVLAPRRWFYTALITAVGSSLGSFALAAVLQAKGLPFLLQISPGLDHSTAWLWTQKLMQRWGDWAVFLIALSPSPQHPAIALAAVAGMALDRVLLMVFAGRALKYLFVAWLASHAPGMLGKLWGIQFELKEVGLEVDTNQDQKKNQNQLS